MNICAHCHCWTHQQHIIGDIFFEIHTLNTRSRTFLYSICKKKPLTVRYYLPISPYEIVAESRNLIQPTQALARATFSVRHPNVIFWRIKRFKRKRQTANIVLYIIYLAYLTQGIVYGVGNLYPQHQNVSVMVPRILCWVLGGPRLWLEAWHGGVDGLQPLADAGVAQPQVLQ